MISELLRFAAVSGVCAAVDLGIGLATITFWSLPVYAAAAVGWCGGTACGYFLHLRWTFSHRRLADASPRFRLYLINGALILFTRWLVIALIGGLFAYDELTLLIAVVASFALNYFVSRTFIFR